MATYTKTGGAKTGTATATAQAVSYPAPAGFSVAVGNNMLDLPQDLNWQRLDDIPNLISGFSIRRGRTDEFDRTGTGTAQIEANDTDASFDTTTIYPGLPAALCLQNPLNDSWHTIFQGFIDEMAWTTHPSQRVNAVSLALVDGLDYLAGYELAPDRDGDYLTQPASTAGNVWYRAVDADLGRTVDYRIHKVLDDASWGETLVMRNVFTGNVHMPGTVYSPGTSALSVIDECAEAEFPGIANRYISKDGWFVFHGRLARFEADNPIYGIQTWKVGDGAAVQDDSSYAQMRGLTFSYSRSKVINSATFTPQGIADADIPGQLVEDFSSQIVYGLHSISGENLRITDSALTGNDANTECRLYGDYYVSVYYTVQTRVNQITFRSLHPDDPRAERVWALMCNIEISDRIQLKCTTPSWTFADELYFVEGISYDVRPLRDNYADVTLTLDLSPAAYYNYDWTP